MNIIGLIRNNGKILVGTIAVSLLFFIVGQGISGLIPYIYGTNKKYYVGKIANKGIPFVQFDDMCNKLKSNFSRTQHRTPNDDEIEIIQNLVWTTFKNEIVFENINKKEFKILGLHISNDEKVEYIQGKETRIAKDLKKIFIDKKTNKFNKKQLMTYLKYLATAPHKERMDWNLFEIRKSFDRMNEKLENIVYNSIYNTDIEIKNKNFYNETSLDLKCLYIPLSSIDDSQIVITDTMIYDYINKHKKEFLIKPSQDILYLFFEIKPSNEDIRMFNNEVSTIVNEFKKCKDDFEFATNHTEGSHMDIMRTLPPKELKKILKNRKHWKRGSVFIEKTDNNKTYKIYKISNIIRNSRNRAYEVVIIEKYLTTGDKTRDEIFKKADFFTNFKGSKNDLVDLAKKNNIEIHEANKITKQTKKINKIDGSRRIIQWLFNKQEKNKKMSPIFEINDSYIVAYKLKNNKAGLAQIKDIKEKVKNLVLKEEKIKMILSKININNTKIENIANQYGNTAVTFSIKNLKFNDINIVNSSNNMMFEQNSKFLKKTIGIAFSLKNKYDITTPFQINDAVIMLQLIDKKQLKQKSSSNNQTTKDKDFLFNYSLQQVFEEQANIVDNRLEYY